ncbi:MAG TPA: helix-turn-helix domain-containing protein [Solirubrobacteraceae bacterium]|jgi:predicted transcriptional regulator|nr:helix-turn-helix domain-containing protein [Solirubrobacteraceae bacterium]
MAESTTPRWKFLTNHAQVLVCIAHDPGVLLREISEQVGITERAAHRIVTELADSGYIKRERNGRRNRYTIQSGVSLPDRLGRAERVGDLLTILTGPGAGTLESGIGNKPRLANNSRSSSRLNANPEVT